MDALASDQRAMSRPIYYKEKNDVPRGYQNRLSRDNLGPLRYMLRHMQTNKQTKRLENRETSSFPREVIIHFLHDFRALLQIVYFLRYNFLKEIFFVVFTVKCVARL